MAFPPPDDSSVTPSVGTALRRRRRKKNSPPSSAWYASGSLSLSDIATGTPPPSLVRLIEYRGPSRSGEMVRTLLAAGGEEGIVSSLSGPTPLLAVDPAAGGDEADDAAFRLDTTTETAVAERKGRDLPKFLQVRRCDEEVTAYAVSYDGARAVLGFADGSIEIFVLAPEDALDDEALGKCWLTKSAFPNSKNLEELDDFMSQDPETQTSASALTSFSGPMLPSPITDLAFDPRSSPAVGYFLAVASETNTPLIIVDVSSASTLVDRGRMLSDVAAAAHEFGAVRSLAYSPAFGADVLLTSVGSDGRVVVFSLSGTDDPALDWDVAVRDDDSIVAREGDLATKGLRACWSGSKMIVPVGPGIDVRERSDLRAGKRWNEFLSDGRAAHTGTVTRVACSPDGKYVATAEVSGRVVLWSGDGVALGILNDPSIEKTTFPPEMGTPMDLLWWNGNGEEEEAILVATADGILHVLGGGRNAIVNIIKKEVQKGIGIESNVNKSERRLSKPTPAQDSDDDVAFDDAGEDSAAAAAKFLDDEAHDGESVAVNMSELPDDSAPIQTVTAVDFNNDDAGTMAYSDGEGDDNNFLAEHNVMEAPDRPILQQDLRPPQQTAFSPASTPEDLSRRILCWNHLGVLTCRTEEDGSSVVDMTFTDTMARRPATFRDGMEFAVGTLGEDGAFFADSGLEDEDGDRNGRFDGSNLFFYRYSSFGPVKEKNWSTSLPTGEKVEVLAVGLGWAAALTSRRLLRIYTSGGLAEAVLWTDGPVVTAVGRGRFLAVVYHDGDVEMDGTQRLAYTIYDVSDGATVAGRGKVPLSKTSRLFWAGWSDGASLVVMDTGEMVSMLVPAGETKYCWAPMLDILGMKKSASDRFWPISVIGGKFVCVPLKGGQENPDAVNRPITSCLKFRMPIGQGAVPKSRALEEVYIRAKAALRQKKIMNEFKSSEGADPNQLEDEYDKLSAQLDKVTIKLFLAACETGKVERALDLCSRLHLDQSFGIVLQVADRFNFGKLIEQIGLVRDQMFPLDQGNGGEDEKHVYDEDDGTVDYDDPDPHEDQYHETRRGNQVHEDDRSLTSAASRVTPPPPDQFRSGRKRKSLASQDDYSEVMDDRRPMRGEGLGASFFRRRSSTEQTLPPAPSTPLTPVKGLNPFASKNMSHETPVMKKSPGGLVLSPQSITPTTKPVLSRMSTFGQESRKKSKMQMQLI